MPKIYNLPDPSIKNMLNEIRELTKNNLTTPDLSTDTSFLSPPEFITEALTLPPDTKKYPYPPPEGFLDTRQAVAEYLNSLYQTTSFTADDIVITLGATGALHLCYQVLLNRFAASELTPGVAVVSGADPGYLSTLNQLGRKMTLHVVPTDEQFRPDFLALHRTLVTHQNIRFVILNYPPTGVALNEAEAQALTQLFYQHSAVHFIMDLTYERFFDTMHRPSLLGVDNVILVHSFSKYFNIPGIRAGFLATFSPGLVKEIADFQASCTGGVPFPIERVIEVICKSFLLGHRAIEDWEQTTKSMYQEHRSYVYDALNEMGLKVIQPDGGFFILFKVSQWINKWTKHGFFLKDDEAIAKYFIKKGVLIAMPGSAFFIDGYLRINCAVTIATLQATMNNLKEQVDLLLRRPSIPILRQRKARIIFDIHDTLACSGNQSGCDPRLLNYLFNNGHYIEPNKFPHFIYPGVVEVFTFLLLFYPDIQLDVFSSAPKETVEDFLLLLLDLISPEHVSFFRHMKKCSRQHLTSTEGRRRDLNDPFKLTCRNHYKDLRKIVTEAELSNTIFVEDSASFVYPGQEGNLLRVQGARNLKEYDTLLTQETITEKEFGTLNSIYYLAGRIAHCINNEEIPISSQLLKLHFKSDGLRYKPRFHQCITEDKNVYSEGLALLQIINPDLKFITPENFRLWLQAESAENESDLMSGYYSVYSEEEEDDVASPLQL